MARPHIAADAILYGTAADERWTAARMKELFTPYLERGEGWSTLPTAQHVRLAGSGDLAWFDEALESAKWGEMRGTGVARKIDGRWRIVHYNTTLPIPDDLFRAVTREIAALGAPPVEDRTPTAVTPEVAAVRAALAGFHRAASEANPEAYFAHLAPDAIYLGTDSQERFTVAQFRARVAPWFEQGKGWTTTPTAQHVWLAPDGDVAWFDERLRSAKWGEMRGSGVLVKRAGGWKIAQYNLSLPVPNELLPELARKIRAQRRGK